MKTGQLILEAMQSVLDELKTSDSRRESHRALTLIKLSEAYEAYSMVIALEDDAFKDKKDRTYFLADGKEIKLTE